MSTTIYVDAELIASEELTERQKSDIEHIKDGYGSGAFSAGMWSVANMFDEINGSDPVEDGIITPLKALIEYAKEEGIVFSEGFIEVTSDWSDYDNLTIKVTDNEITYHNTQLLEADTSELVKELQARGILPVDFTYKEAA